MERIWHKWYGDKIPAEINPDSKASVVAMLDDAMQRFAPLTAFSCGDSVLSYAEVDRLSRQFAAYLQHELGVKKGDRIAMMSPNILAFPVGMIGLLRAGAVQVNVNPLYTPRELEHQLNDAGVETIVIFSGSLPTLASVLDKTPVKNIIVAELHDLSANGGKASDGALALPGSIRFTDAIARGVASDFRPVALKGDDLIYLQYTGGTTGVSKGAMLSHRNLASNIMQFRAFAPDMMREGQEVVITALPLYHIFGLMVNCLSYFTVGGTNHLIANPRDMDSFIGVLKKSRFSVISGVNTLFTSLMQHPGFKDVDFSNYRVAFGGGAAVLRATSDKWKSFTGRHIMQGYGLSETSPVLTFNPPHLEEFTDCVGIPLSSTDISLRDDEGNEVPLGEAGEICAKGPQVMRGYWRRLDDNSSAFWPDGYFRTGDIAVADADGYFRIVDRKKDMILVSGFNVYPNEIEAVAASCPGVAECACIGVPDDKTGEAVKLFIVKTAGSALTEREVLDHCRKELVAYKMPRQVVFRTELPKSTVGKILRRSLRDEELAARAQAAR